MNERPSLSKTSIAAALILLLAAIFPAFAQERFSTIVGDVKDASGGVIADAAVTVTNKETGRTTSAKSDGRGAYVVRSLEPGRYRVHVEATGFTPFEVGDVLLVLSKESRVDASLMVGGTQQTIEVSEASPLIDTSGTTVSNNVTAEEFNLLPKSRSFQSMVALSPSVNTGQVEGGFQVNGASGSENQFFVDGVTTNSLIDGRSRQNGAFEFLQEVQVKTGGIDAEYGGATGGVISAITRSGGNAFHGEAHYYLTSNAFSAGPVQRLLLLNPYNSTSKTPTYQQDYKPQNDQHEVGGSLGGYLLRDRLWFFSSYSPQMVRRSQDYIFGNGIDTDTLKQSQTAQQLFNKLSWNATSKLRFTASWLWTPTRTEGLLTAYNSYGNSVTTSKASVQSLKNQGWTQPQSNYSGQMDYTIDATSLLSIRGGRFWDNFRTWGIAPVSSVTFQTSTQNALELPADLRQAAGFSNTPRLQNTFFDIATRTYVQADYSKFLSGFWGSHDIKVGGGYQKNVNKVDNTYPGSGYVFVYWGAQYNPPGSSSTPIGGKYGYYDVNDVGTRGSTGGTIANLYIQDHWRIAKRLTLTLGLRTENEHVPSFVRSIRDNAFSFDFSQKLSPRVGVSWDVNGNGKYKVYGSYARIYGWVPYETSRGTFGGDFWHVYHRALDTTDLLSLSGTNKPGANIFPYGDFEDLRQPSFDSVPEGLKPMSTDLINAGIEMQLAANMVLRAGYVGNHLVRTIEDMGALVNGNETYIFANPGEGAGEFFAPSTATPTIRTPKPIRNYDAFELTLTKRFSNSFFASASYVYSRLYGNYAGLGNSDEISTPTTGVSSGTTQQSGGSIARPGSTGSRAWDIDQYLFDSHGNFVEGRLATDRPHVFKAYGSYKFKWGTDIGGFLYAGSGTPVSTVVNQTNRIGLFVNGRGDLGRTPILSQTDLMVGHEIKFGETKRLRFEFNAQNVFNQKTARHIFNQLNRGAGSGYTPAAINLTNVNLYNGYDYRALLNAKFANGVDPYDPRYNMPDLFNPGFQGRIGLKFFF